MFNGHGDQIRDLIPAPEGGYPTQALTKPLKPNRPPAPVIPVDPVAAPTETTINFDTLYSKVDARQTATEFIKFKSELRPQAIRDLQRFANSLPAGACVSVYGFAGFNAKQWALDISQMRPRAVADYLEGQGFTTVVVDGLAKTNAADFLGSPLAHNRMVVLSTQRQG